MQNLQRKAADADALMDDYFEKFYGPEAGPAMKQYWLRIDKAFAEMKCESGSFFALHLVYTDEFLGKQGALLATAAKAAKGEKAYEQRVAMTREGFLNAVGYARLPSARYRARREARGAGAAPEVGARDKGGRRRRVAGQGLREHAGGHRFPRTGRTSPRADLGWP